MSGLTFTVLGVPIPKGSTKAFLPKGWKRPIITHDNARTKPWQEAVVSGALEALGDAPMIEQPVTLCVRFFLPRPKSAKKCITCPAKKPDLDKLVRAVKDGLTRAGVYRDDAQVVTIIARKDFAGGINDPDAAGIPRAIVGVDVVSAVIADPVQRTILSSTPAEVRA